jgi:hypothetical protein
MSLCCEVHRQLWAPCPSPLVMPHVIVCACARPCGRPCFMCMSLCCEVHRQLWDPCPSSSATDAACDCARLLTISVLCGESHYDTDPAQPCSHTQTNMSVSVSGGMQPGTHTSLATAACLHYKVASTHARAHMYSYCIQSGQHTRASTHIYSYWLLYTKPPAHTCVHTHVQLHVYKAASTHACAYTNCSSSCTRSSHCMYASAHTIITIGKMAC